MTRNIFCLTRVHLKMLDQDPKFKNIHPYHLLLYYYVHVDDHGYVATC